MLKNLLEYYENFEWIPGQTPFSASWHPIVWSMLYLIVIYGLKYYMKNKKEANVRFFMILHNGFLVFISALMFFGILFEVIKTINKGDTFFDLICDPQRKFNHGPLFFWAYVYYLSKYYEFIDTFFIILKNKELIFLHVYHHTLVVFLTWAGMNTYTSNQWIASMVNTLVHVFMYYYFMMSTVTPGFTVWWKKYLTTMQMVQFWFLMILLLYFLYLLYTNAGCTGEIWSAQFCFFGQITFFILFKHFYNTTYSPKNKNN